MEWLKLIASVVAGLIAAIPLVAQLVKYVHEAIKAKNWPKIMELIIKEMKRAEKMFETGADRKKWVLEMVTASAEAIDYDVNIIAIEELIDGLCDMSKVVNTPDSDSANK